MTNSDCNPAADTEHPQALGQLGPVRRFLAGWKRMEELMDYTPYDCVNDRLRALEARIAVLEHAAAATPTACIAPSTAA